MDTRVLKQQKVLSGFWLFGCPWPIEYNWEAYWNLVAMALFVAPGIPRCLDWRAAWDHVNFTANSSSTLPHTRCKVELSNCPGQAPSTEFLPMPSYSCICFFDTRRKECWIRLLGSHDGDGCLSQRIFCNFAIRWKTKEYSHWGSIIRVYSDTTISRLLWFCPDRHGICVGSISWFCLECGQQSSKHERYELGHATSSTSSGQRRGIHLTE